MKGKRFKEKKKLKLPIIIFLLICICVFLYSLFNIIYWIKSNNDLKTLEEGVFKQILV